MEILSKLFSSAPLVRIMRLFLFNQDRPYDLEDVALHSRTKASSARYELFLLTNIGFLKRKRFSKKITARRGRHTYTRTKRAYGWQIDPDFRYLKPLRALLIDSDLVSEGEIKRRLKSVSGIALIITSGVFLQDSEGRIDLLVAGNRVSKSGLTKAVKALEATVGKELRFASFSNDDFLYRLNIRDRLVRDVLDYPHHVLLNKIPDLSLSPAEARYSPVGV